MLPGFNHNIRYKDRVFHVQTEDNGIGQPRLVTQVFIEGHILAVEKASYQDILDSAADRDERTQMIRSKMQDQHRRLLKNLVQGAYDERITLYLGGPRSQPGGTPALVAPVSDGAAAIPPALLDSAELIPEAPSALGEAEPDAWQPLRPEDLIEIEEPVDDVADTLRPAARGDAQTRLADDLEAPPISKPSHRPLPKDVADSSEFLSVLDAEMQRQLPWASSDEIMASPPPLRLDSNPGQEPPGKAEAPAPPPKAQPNFRDARRTAKVESPGLLKKAPPAADTLVDFGLPAALREQLAANLEARKKADSRRPPGSPSLEPRSGGYGPAPGPIRDDLPRRPSAMESAAERQTVLDMELRRAAAEMSVPPGRSAPPTASDTLLEIDARELHRRVAEQRARLRSSPSEAPTPEPGPLPHTERRPAEPLERFDSKRPTRTPSSGIRVTPVIQGEAVSPPPPEAENPKSILVVERSLDEVILSYLSDDQE
ncbi:MAG: hypothetical protein IPG45_21335 [Deltaproteobacteria bacterium]|jgi:hypothetical protein|nr:hypothetical protein [Deltaproteobacteria bacterium]